MITSIKIDNFKSLVNFKLELAKFNCVVGLNGCGKSTLLQALDFISRMMEGNITDWLEKRQWSAADLNSKLSARSNITFEVACSLDNKQLIWEGSFNRRTLGCTKESVAVDGKKILGVEDGHFLLEGVKGEILFEHQGSILSLLKENQLNNTLLDLKKSIPGIRSLDLLSPELLRSRTRASGGKLGLGGERLSSLIHETGTSGKKTLKEALLQVYPQIEAIQTKSLRSGWKQLEARERFGDKTITSTARHLNDGMLRLMAILLQLQIDNAFLLFDEIENGINPALIEYLIDHLVNTDHQVLVTTHSPMILNFMKDNVAKQGVIYLYKNSDGITRPIRLFDIPSMAKKLEMMGPGEAFIDTDLTALYREIEAMPKSEA